MRELRVSAETNARLEELRTEIRRTTGRSVTTRELLSRIVEDACESPDEIVDSFRGSSVPLSESEKQAMRRGRFESGTDTGEDDIDDILYR